jgi:hypothetical protein
MHNLHCFPFFCLAVIAFNSASAEAGTSADVFTPVIASTISPEAHPIRGTDGGNSYGARMLNTGA